LFGALGALGVVGMATSASAADLAARPYTKAPSPVVAAAYDWSGFYIGLNGGGGWSRKCWDITQDFGILLNPARAEGCHEATGGTVGGQVGYRWQSAAWVFGVEAQGNWADFKGSNTSLYFGAVGINRTKVDAVGLFTGQIGYSWNNLLLYVKGGAAVTSDRYEGYSVPGAGVFDRATETRWGGVVGVGAEYGFAPNWSLAFEYDHLFMGTRDVSLYTTGLFLAAGAFTRNDRIRQAVDMFTARINYRWGGPVVAKY
jgi:outer membrane immunogenic protein